MILVEAYIGKEKKFVEDNKELLQEIKKNFGEEFLPLFRKYPYVKAIYFSIEDRTLAFDECFFSFYDDCGDYTSDPGHWFYYNKKGTDAGPCMKEFNKFVNSLPKTILELLAGKKKFNEGDYVQICIDNKGKVKKF